MIVQTKEVPQAKKDRLSEKPISSDTFKPTGRILGYGCWGVVSEYSDLSGQKWAIKRFAPDETARKQMEQRKLTEEEVMRKESIPLTAAKHNVVPRIIERDRNGEIYLGMPVYTTSLEDKLRFNQNLDVQDAAKIGRDIAEGLSYLHNIERRAHGDIKPSNVLMENNRAFISDLGSSTCISVSDRSKDPRDKIGDLNYRAPEGFKENSHPTNSSDVFSAGAVLYSLIAKEGIYEGLKRNVETLSENDFNRFIKQKLKKAPRKLRKFLGKCLNYDPYSRYYDGEAFKQSLDQVIENLDSWKSFKNNFKRLVLPIGLPAAMFSIAIYGAAVHEPQKLDMPSIQPKIGGMLYKPGQEDTNNISFETESITNLPQAINATFDFSRVNEIAKQLTDNRVVAYLTKTYEQAALMDRGYPITERQQEIYNAYTYTEQRNHDIIAGPVWPVATRSIEVALNQSKTIDGKLDLEDTMAIARIGVEKVLEAKRVSGSQDYEIYRAAKDRDGNLIIDKSDRKFIDLWLSYYHSDIN